MSSLHTIAAEIDQTLRGGHSRPEALGEGRIDVPVRQLVLGSLIFGMVYGLSMGLYGALRATEHGWLFLAASMLKVPLVFLCTLIVTFPSLYTFSALAGSTLGAKATLRLILIAITVNLAILAGFAPVTAFFVMCTESYVFVKLLNVLFFGIAGLVSLVFLKRALGHVFGEKGGRSKQPASAIFRVWFVIYGIVGAQMGWVLRPFVGSPDLPFEWFRETESNILFDLAQSIRALFG